MRIPLHNLLTNFSGRGMTNTNKGETRYFRIDDDVEKFARVTGLDDGGLVVEKLSYGKWKKDLSILDCVFKGVPFIEITESDVPLPNQKT